MTVPKKPSVTKTFLRSGQRGTQIGAGKEGQRYLDMIGRYLDFERDTLGT